MMKTIGCYIRYDFSLQSAKVNHTDPVFDENRAKSAEDCANKCIVESEASAESETTSELPNPSNCIDGWSYQIATGRCLLFSSANTTLLNPNRIMMGSQKTIGWISGTDMCKINGNSETYICLKV